MLDKDLPISRAGIFAAEVAPESRTPRIPALAPIRVGTSVPSCTRVSEHTHDWLLG